MKILNTFSSSVVRTTVLLAVLLLVSRDSFALGAKTYITTKNGKGEFVLSASGKCAPLFASPEDYWGVKHALRDLQSDITKVTGAKPEISTGKLLSARDIVVAGTIGKSPLINELIRNKKIDVREIEGKWESFIIKVVDKPFRGIDRALVIVGSDKRGTIYGIYDVSEKIGVSPWYWWAGVPPKHRSALSV
ncbi:MAG: glycosyl hydrolase, partial [Bacteroidetes bacterium]|nr:glycosyl hydrolase [Bacteroidota bacterium]